MAHAANADQGDDGEVAYTLKLFRVKPNQRFTIRTLSHRIDGLITHYFKPPKSQGESKYCPGEEQGCAYHKLPKLWKGYAAVEVWDSHSGLWFPTVLEITEHLELDFRGVWKRGQQWVLSRAAEVKEKRTPVVAGLLGEDTDPKLPRAFDYLPVLQTVYHCPAIQLGCANPLPARVVLKASTGAPPIGTVFKDVPKQSDADQKTFRELLQAYKLTNAQKVQQAKEEQE